MTLEQEFIKSQADLSAAHQTIAAQKDHISEIKAQVDELQKTLQAEREKSDSLAKTISAEQAARAEEKKAHEAAIAAKEAEVETRANKKVHERAAQLGIAPVRQENGSSTSDSGTLARAEWKKLSPSAQLKLAKSGVKIID